MHCRIQRRYKSYQSLFLKTHLSLQSVYEAKQEEKKLKNKILQANQNNEILPKG